MCVKTQLHLPVGKSRGQGAQPNCQDLTLPFVLSALQELQLDTDPGVQRAALETLKILDTCSQHQLLASPKGIS